MTAGLGFHTVQGYPALAVNNQCTEWLFLLQYCDWLYEYKTNNKVTLMSLTSRTNIGSLMPLVKLRSTSQRMIQTFKPYCNIWSIPFATILLILITFSIEDVLMLLRKNCRWSHLGPTKLKGLTAKAKLSEAWLALRHCLYWEKLPW